MPKIKPLATSQEWFDQSILLIEARPTTTRITTKYSIKRPRIKSDKDTPAPAAPADAAPRAPRANLTLKTFDPVSGVVLKYKTTKAAEVNRLIQVLGKLSKGMAGLKGARDDVLGTGAAAAAVDESEKPAAEGAAAAKGGPQGQAQGQGQGQGGGGGGKKKKKGKK